MQYTTQYNAHPVIHAVSDCDKADIKSPITSSYQLLALINKVRGHFTVTHKLLEAQKIQTAGTQTKEKVYYNQYSMLQQ